MGRQSPFRHVGFIALAAFMAFAWFSFDRWSGAAAVAPERETVTEFARPSRAPAIAVSVLDGDTIRVSDQTYRLVGFNTPETGRQAQCDSESALGRAATLRLRELVAGGSLDFERVACACRPGTEGTRQCNYGRLCGTLKSHGRDVGGILISEGLAHAYACRGTSCPRRQSWCG
jgi:endonuclease YncB( thermonuclease family)